MAGTKGTLGVNDAALAGIASERFLTVAQRIQRGRALRASAARSSHAAWVPPDDRADPVSLLQESAQGRFQDLVPLRYGRMAESPFSFLRGAANIMAADLASTPTTGITVQICGDAHLGNFGIYGSPERNLVFDVNDFDETLPGPWEWDIKRLAVSVIVAGRASGYSDAECRTAAAAAVQAYRQWMETYARMRYLEIWYSRLDTDAVRRVLPTVSRQPTEQRLRQARSRDNLQALTKLTATVDGRVRLVDEPPLLTHLTDDPMGRQLATLLQDYLPSLQDDRRTLIERYRIVDAARKVVGVGSVGTRCYLLLLVGQSDDDPLFLQVKEARASVLETHLGQGVSPNHGQRVVRGQRLIQAVSDIFLGWGRIGETDFYLRQFRDMKRALPVATMSAAELVSYAGLCGWTLARAHARSGDAAMISGYLGKSRAFDDAIMAFAEAYAGQTERDHAALLAAIKAGRIVAST